jgi:single-stranded-DNA-specific exonuclease
LTPSAEEADGIACQLDAENRRRKVLEEQILTEAQRQWETLADGRQRVIVLDSPNWHIGIVGIVASKLVEEYHLPTVLICTNTEPAKGSARSIPRFHLYEALTRCQPYLAGYGGHEHAAGVSINQTDIPAFRDKLNQIALETLKEEDLIPQLTIDTELGLEKLGADVMEDIARLAPFGQANPRPIFCIKGIQMMRYPRKVGGKHLKMKLRQGQRVIDSIGFNLGALQPHLCQHITSPVDVAFQPQLNDWQGKRQLQLKLKDVQLT